MPLTSFLGKFLVIQDSPNTVNETVESTITHLQGKTLIQVTENIVPGTLPSRHWSVGGSHNLELNGTFLLYHLQDILKEI